MVTKTENTNNQYKESRQEQQNQEFAVLKIQQFFLHHSYYLKKTLGRDSSYIAPVYTKPIADPKLEQATIRSWQKELTSQSDLTQSQKITSVYGGIYTYLPERLTLGAYNKKNELEVIALFDINENEKCIVLEFLASSPHNLTKKPSIRGGGTALIEGLIFMALKIFPDNIDTSFIKVRSIQDASFFYESRGFQFDKKDLYYKLQIKDRHLFLKKFGSRGPFMNISK